MIEEVGVGWSTVCLKEGSKEKERVRVEDEEAGKSREKQPETREAGDFSRMPREGRWVVTSLSAGRDGVVRGSSVHSEVAAYLEICVSHLVVGTGL